jgi:hypothetical protein
VLKRVALRLTNVDYDRTPEVASYFRKIFPEYLVGIHPPQPLGTLVVDTEGFSIDVGRFASNRGGVCLYSMRAFGNDSRGLGKE